MFEGYIVKAMLLVFIFSGIPLLAGSLTGLIVSIIQTATQIQEQTVSYLVKFVSICGAIALCSSWYSDEMLSFTRVLLENLVMLGRG